MSVKGVKKHRISIRLNPVWVFTFTGKMHICMGLNNPSALYLSTVCEPLEHHQQKLHLTMFSSPCSVRTTSVSQKLTLLTLGGLDLLQRNNLVNNFDFNSITNIMDF